MVLVVPLLSTRHYIGKHWHFLNCQNSQLANSKNIIFECLISGRLKMSKKFPGLFWLVSFDYI